MHDAAPGVCGSHATPAGTLLQCLVVCFLSVTGIADGGDLATDILQSFFFSFPLDAVSNPARLLFCIGHMSGIIVFHAVAVFHLPKQGFHSLMYVGVGAGSEPLGVAAPLYATPGGA